MTNESFLKASYHQKVNELILRTKELIQRGETLKPYFFLFDKSNKLHVIDIKEELLLKPGREAILRSIVQEKIEYIAKKGVEINKILHIRESKFNAREDVDFYNMDLDSPVHKMHGEPALMVSVEDPYEYELKIYDIIRIEDEGRTFSVISKEPIVDVETSKLDPDHNIRTLFKNII
jgi:hypothetical protein